MTKTVPARGQITCPFCFANALWAGLISGILEWRGLPCGHFKGFEGGTPHAVFTKLGDEHGPGTNARTSR